MIQFISHFTDKYSYLDGIGMALDGGCRWIQLRMKDANVSEILPVALEAQRLCKEAGATFIIDDHVNLVKEINADGVHLGKKDMPIKEARRILGQRYIIGGTANTSEDVLAHWRDGADYIGCGPYRFTTTKQGLSPILGLDGYQKIISAMKKEGIGLPIVAIGGIEEKDVHQIMQTGVSGIALSGSILRAENPEEQMEKIIKLANQYTLR